MRKCFGRIRSAAAASSGVGLIVMLPVLVTTLTPLTGRQRSSAMEDEAVLVALQQTLAKAWVGGDRATIERIIAPQWISTGPDGRMTDRSRVLADVFDNGVHKIRLLEIDDVSARVFGDGAVVVGRTHGVGEFAGTAYDVVIRFTDTFMRLGGRWQAVASHASIVQSR